MAKNTYRDFVQRIAVTWLLGEWSEKLLYAAAETLDAIVDAVEEAAKVRFIDQAPADSLGRHGDDSNLPRYAPDTTATYRARLEQRFDTWRSAGTASGWETPARGLIGQLNAFGFVNATIYRNADWDAYAWPHDSAPWSRFWVVLDMPHVYTWPIWGAITWGSFTWGFLQNGILPIDLTTALQRLVKKFKPAAEVCDAIIVVGDTDTPVWGHNMTWGSFTWGPGTNGQGIARIPGAP